MKTKLWLVAGLFVALLCSSRAATIYVKTNGNDSAAGTNWATAKQTIQAGVNVAASNDTVLVTNGTYVLTGQITVSNAITVRSINGPVGTIVNGNGQVTLSRGFYLGANCTLDGFTVTNGYVNDQYGGGVYCVNTNAIMTNCTISGNTAYSSSPMSGTADGGGTYGGTLNNCTIIGNSSSSSGGGASCGTLNNCTISSNSAGRSGGGVSRGRTWPYNSTLNNCTLIGNSAPLGGGVDDCTLINCTLIGNSASGGGGGTYGCTLNNCMLISNSAGSGGGVYYGGTLNNCTLTGNSATNGNGGGTYGGTLNNCIVYYNNGTNNYVGATIRYTCAPDAPVGFGNTTNAPMFVNTNTGNYRLSVGSPCINAGHNSLAPTNVTPGGFGWELANLERYGGYGCIRIRLYSANTHWPRCQRRNLCGQNSGLLERRFCDDKLLRGLAVHKQ